jgi:hypothetical protein
MHLASQLAAACVLVALPPAQAPRPARTPDPFTRVERALVRELRGDEATRRRLACWALCVWSRWQPRLYATLHNELDHPDPAIRRAIASALGHFPMQADDVLHTLRRAPRSRWARP